jgi:hypothetical protein
MNMYKNFTKSYPHHVQRFWRVDKDAVEYVQHTCTFSGSLRTQSAEKPVQSVRLGELSAIRMISPDYGG